MSPDLSVRKLQKEVCGEAERQAGTRASVNNFGSRWESDLIMLEFERGTGRILRSVRSIMGIVGIGTALTFQYPGARYPSKSHPIVCVLLTIRSDAT
jgi:hypothetical protein